jgi:hypothetical protein
MVDFVEMAENKWWPHLPDPPFLDDSRLAQGPFYQDMLMTDAEAYRHRSKKPATLDDVAGEVAGGNRTNVGDKYAKPSDRTGIYLENSILWPVRTLERGCVAPYVAFLVGGALISPIVSDDLTYGSAVVAGYAFGVAMNYVQVSQMPAKNVDKSVKK